MEPWETWPTDAAGIAELLASEHRLICPHTKEELEALYALTLAPPRFPPRLGLIAAVFVEFMTGRRSIVSAITFVEEKATVETLPDTYAEALINVLGQFLRLRRLREALTLSELLQRSLRKVYGTSSRRWIEAARAYVQAVAQSRPLVGDPQVARPSVDYVDSVATNLEQEARHAAHSELKASALAASGQYWWTSDAETEELRRRQLARAEDAIAEAASLRAGAERGRSLATLAQIRKARLELGDVDVDAVSTAASEAVSLTDRTDRPAQWFIAYNLAADYRAAPDADPLTAEELERIVTDHGHGVAAQALQAGGRMVGRLRGACAATELIKQGWEIVDIAQLDNERWRSALLAFAVHWLDSGCSPCKALTAAASNASLKRLLRLPKKRRPMPCLHLALHSPVNAKVFDWALSAAPGQLGVPETSAEQDAGLFALALICH